MKPQSQNIVEKDYTYHFDGKECHICGICTFSHFHKAGTKPNEFIHLDVKQMNYKEQMMLDEAIASAELAGPITHYLCEPCKAKGIAVPCEHFKDSYYMHHEKG